MSRKNALQAIQPCTQPHPSLLDSCRTRSSTRTHTSTSLASYSYSTQDDLDPLDGVSSDIDLDQRSASSETLLSRRVSLLSTNQLLTDTDDTSSEFTPFTRPSESRRSRFRFPLHEPGQMTARRTQRLRARTAAVIMSIPATCEDLIEDEPWNPVKVPSSAQTSKLRRVSGVRDLRCAFRDGDKTLAHDDSIPSLGVSKASYELGILVTPSQPLPALSLRSSLCTLVDAGNGLSCRSSDAKTLYDSTLGSMTASSRFTTKLYSTFSLSRTTDTPQSKKYQVHNLSTTRTRRHTSLQLDTSSSPGERVWSCAKISQSAAKRAARYGHTPRRVFSNPMAPLPP